VASFQKNAKTVFLVRSDDDDDIGDEWFQCEWPNCHKSFSSAARLSLHVSRHRPQTGPRRRRRRRRKRKWAGPRKKPRPDNSDGVQSLNKLNFLVDKCSNCLSFVKIRLQCLGLVTKRLQCAKFMET